MEGCAIMKRMGIFIKRLYIRMEAHKIITDDQWYIFAYACFWLKIIECLLIFFI